MQNISITTHQRHRLEHNYKEERSKSAKHFCIHRTSTVYLYFCWIRITTICCKLNPVFLHNSFLKLYCSACQLIQIMVSLITYVWDQHKLCSLPDINLKGNARASSKMRSLKFSSNHLLSPTALTVYKSLFSALKTFRYPKLFFYSKAPFPVMKSDSPPKYTGLFRGYHMSPNEIISLGNGS